MIDARVEISGNFSDFMDGHRYGHAITSLFGEYQDIRRAKTVRVQAYGLDGQAFEMVCSELPSRVWQHEIDHLNGTLFIDKMGPLARMSSKKALEDYINDFQEALKKGTLPPGTEMKL